MFARVFFVLGTMLVHAPLAVSPLAAQPRTGPPPSGRAPQPGTETAGPPRADDYTQRVRSGIQLLMNGDTAGAIRAFNEASAMDAARPEAPYYLGTAHRMSGNF